jgi:hypothetical protein
MALVSYTRGVKRKGSGFLLESEAFLSALLCRPNGTVRRALAEGAVNFAANLAVDNAIKDLGLNAQVPIDISIEKKAKPQKSPVPLADSFPSRSDLVLAITTQGVLLFRTSPHGLSYRLHLIKAYTHEQVTRFTIRNLGALRKMEVSFSDGSSVGLDIPKGQDDPRQFIAQFDSIATG